MILQKQYLFIWNSPISKYNKKRHSLRLHYDFYKFQASCMYKLWSLNINFVESVNTQNVQETVLLLFAFSCGETSGPKRTIHITLWIFLILDIISDTFAERVLMMNHDMCWIMWTAWFHSGHCCSVMHTDRNCMWVVCNYINKFRSYTIYCKKILPS